ncbi:MAG: amino acid-binding protein [Thaumarchaeota archaeon]|nr:amino acid-binding protein [Nitrososphaerota archaeon]
MWRQIQTRFTRQKARLSVVRKMIELGIGLAPPFQLCVGDVNVSDSALAEAVGVDRRVVRSTVKQIMQDPDLRDIFTQVKPIGVSLVDIAKKLGYSVLVVYADPHKPGVISGISTILSDYNVVIRQALADDPDFIPDPKLTLVLDGRVPPDAIGKIQSLAQVDSLTLKR